MHTVGPGKMATKLKKVKNETDTLYDLDMAKNSEKLEIYIVGPGLWQEN